jgi:hypothetical protein
MDAGRSSHLARILSSTPRSHWILLVDGSAMKRRSLRSLVSGGFGQQQKEPAVSAVVESSAGSALPERMGMVLDAARAAIAQEFQISERIDAKARNQMTVAAAWYGLVQAGASIVLRGNHPHLGRSWFWTIVALGIAGAVGFAWALLFSFRVWRVKDEEEVTVNGLLEMRTAAQDLGRDFANDLLQHYRSILQARRKNNAARVSDFRLSEWGWAACIVMALAEIVVALAVVTQTRT